MTTAAAAAGDATDTVPASPPTTEPDVAAGGAPPEWLTALPEELRSDKSLLQIKDIPSLAKGYVETKKMVGGTVRLPKDDAPKEEWDKFYTAIGRPAKLEDYKVTTPQFDPELEIAIDEAAVKEFTGFFHGIGLTPKQAQAVLDRYGEYTVSIIDKETRSAAERRGTTETALKKEWGAAYPRNIALAKQAVRDLFNDSPALSQAIERAGNDPDLVKGLVQIGQKMLEHGEITGQIPPGETEASLQAEIASLRTKLEANPGDAASTDKYLAATRRLLKMGGRLPTT